MPMELNHTIIWCSDQETSSRFLAEMFGRPAPTRFGHFHVVQLDNNMRRWISPVATARLRPSTMRF